jgi:hypothetical protein
MRLPSEQSAGRARGAIAPPGSFCMQAVEAADILSEKTTAATARHRFDV